MFCFLLSVRRSTFSRHDNMSDVSSPEDEVEEVNKSKHRAKFPKGDLRERGPPTDVDRRRKKTNKGHDISEGPGVPKKPRKLSNKHIFPGLSNDAITGKALVSMPVSCNYNTIL